MAASKDTFETNFFRIVDTLEPESSGTGKPKSFLAIGEGKKGSIFE